MVYKIGLLGTHGTGKTTLAYDIASGLKKKNDLSVEVISEIAKLAKRSGFPIDKGTTLETQGWILLNQCAYELWVGMYNEVIICDRTVFDNEQYLCRAVGNEHHYAELVRGHAKNHPYDALYYLPMTSEFSTKERDPDPEFRREIDNLILDYITQNLPHCIKLPPDKTDQWVNIVVQKTLKDLRGD